MRQVTVARRLVRYKGSFRERGFTLVEVLVVLAVVPLVLAVAFSAVSVALRAYRVVDARASLSVEGARVMEIIAADLRGARAIYADSSANRLRGLLQDGVSKLDYVFTRSVGSPPGTLTRNGENLLRSGLSVSSCEFTYLAPQNNPELPPQATDPDKASLVKVRLALLCEGISMTYESVFSLRNL